MTRRRRRILVIEFEQLLKASRPLAVFDASALELGYERTGATLYRTRSSGWTARVVWRNRRDFVSSMSFTVRGLVIE